LHVYLPILLVAFLTVMPLIQLSEKKLTTKSVLALGIAALFLAQSFLFIYPQAEINIIMALLVFFLGFSLLEAILPSLVSKIAPNAYRGSAVGIFSTCQFFGIFLGGCLGGLVHYYFNLNTVFLFCAILATLWLIVVLRMKEIPLLKTRLLRINKSLDEQQATHLIETFSQIPGVLEANISLDEGIAYLKVDNTILNKDHLQQATQQLHCVEYLLGD
jgi:MFS family permease